MNLAALPVNFGIGLFGALLLDEGDGLLDHRDGVILARAIAGRGGARENEHGCQAETSSFVDQLFTFSLRID